jgi:hypothetical protein
MQGSRGEQAKVRTGEINKGRANLDKLGTEVLVLVLKLNCLGHSDTILGDLWSAEGLLDENVATLRRAKVKAANEGRRIDTAQRRESNSSGVLF